VMLMAAVLFVSGVALVRVGFHHVRLHDLVAGVGRLGHRNSC